MDPTDPVLSVLTVAGDPEAMLRTYVSLATQSDRRWEWCLAGSSGADPRGAASLPLDPRLAAAGPAVADESWAESLARAFRVATGGHVMVVRAGDALAPGAVAAVDGALQEQCWGYADEAQQSYSGEIIDVWRKPDHSPELMRSQPFPVRSCFLPRAVLEELGGIRSSAASAAWYDAVLRVSEVTGPAVHIAQLLVVRADPDPLTRFVPGDPSDHLEVVKEHCRRVGIALDDVETITMEGVPIGQRLTRSLPRSPSVSIVIPTRGGTSTIRGTERTHVTELVRSLAKCDYPNVELVVVYDEVTPPQVLEELRAIAGDRLTLCGYDGWFDFSRKCNLGALAAGGDYLCFLNDDMEVVAPDWLAEMVTLLDDPEVGAVGARLLFEDGTLQHAGHVYVGGSAGHAFFAWDAATLAQGGIAQLTGERSGVTAACMLVRASDFRRVGGFSAGFPRNYNDVDLCLKLRELGYRILYTPYAELYHFESQTRDPRILPSERSFLSRRWFLRMRREAFVNEHGQPTDQEIAMLSGHRQEGPGDWTAFRTRSTKENLDRGERSGNDRVVRLLGHVLLQRPSGAAVHLRRAALADLLRRRGRFGDRRPRAGHRL